MNGNILPVIKMMMQWVPQPLVSCLASVDVFQPFVAWISCKKYSSIKVIPHVKDFRVLTLSSPVMPCNVILFICP
jgi:hypothetical protein